MLCEEALILVGQIREEQAQLFFWILIVLCLLLVSAAIYTYNEC